MPPPLPSAKKTHKNTAQVKEHTRYLYIKKRLFRIHAHTHERGQHLCQVSKHEVRIPPHSLRNRKERPAFPTPCVRMVPSVCVWTITTPPCTCATLRLYVHMIIIQPNTPLAAASSVACKSQERRRKKHGGESIDGTKTAPYLEIMQRTDYLLVYCCTCLRTKI